MAMAERHCATLARLTARGELLAARLAERAEAEADLEQAERLALAFDRVFRGLRQAMLTEAKLARDARREAEEIRRLDADEADRRLEARKAHVRATLRPEVRDDADRASRFHCLMLDAEHLEGFADEPVETVLARLRRMLDLSEKLLDGPTPDTASVIPDAAQPRSGIQEPQAPAPSAHRAGGHPSGASTPPTAPNPDSAWVPAVAGMSGEEVRILNSS